MSQISNESADKQNLNQRIKFVFSWIATCTIIRDNNDVIVMYTLPKGVFWTNYKFFAIEWYLGVTYNEIFLNTAHHISETGEQHNRIWSGSCFISYKMYCDNDMEVELYSSERISTESGTDGDSFRTPEGALAESSEAFEERRVAKMKINFELELDVKYFLRPFELPYLGMNTKICDHYPPDMDDNFKFEFLKECDYIIKCPDGTMPALKMVLNITSGFMNKHFKQTNNNELIVEHKLDVVKPVITYLHSLCFEMPASYDVDFAKRLLTVIDFFELQFDRKIDIRQSIYYSLCQKFVKETLDFSSILQWTSFAIQYGFSRVLDMIRSVIVDKYYDEWNKTFPENARNKNNPKFAELLDCNAHVNYYYVYKFGSQENYILQFFREIDRIYKDSKQCSYVLL